MLSIWIVTLNCLTNENVQNVLPFFSITAIQTARNEEWTYPFKSNQCFLEMGPLPWTKSCQALHYSARSLQRSVVRAAQYRISMDHDWLFYTCENPGSCHAGPCWCQPMGHEILFDVRVWWDQFCTVHVSKGTKLRFLSLVKFSI